MQKSKLTLFLEINDLNYVFYICKISEQNNCEVVYNSKMPLDGIRDNRVVNSEKVFNLVKENIFKIEQKFNETFNEIVLILENFNPSFVNVCGYKKLNGSQILRENITYILNSLKSYVDEIEPKKTILHIFNSKYLLDNKKVENLPIGLFGDFYSHELSFSLINTNDYKNLKVIFEKCNLKVKKILIKSFIKGANLSDNYKGIDTFFHLKINNNYSKIFYFENNSLKSELSFNFGTNIIISDISKITSLKVETIKKILNQLELKADFSEEENIEKKYFEEDNYIKIKKKLIYEIALARLKEISEIILFKNVNYESYKKVTKAIFLEIDSCLKLNGLEKMYREVFSKNEQFDLNIIQGSSNDSLLRTVNKLVHFGWKNEAIPITQAKKSLIGKLFEGIFS